MGGGGGGGGREFALCVWHHIGFMVFRLSLASCLDICSEHASVSLVVCVLYVPKHVGKVLTIPIKQSTLKILVF